MGSVPTVALWLFVINLGVAFGAGLYEQRIVVPRWLSPSSDSNARWNAQAARADEPRSPRCSSLEGEI